MKAAYTLTLAELQYENLTPTKFFIFFVFTTMITLVLMNLIIAILSDAYELVQSEKKYYDGKVKIQRSLMYERFVILFLRLLRREKEEEYHYLFVSMPLSFEDDTNNEDEGMIGKILNVVRNNHKENQEKALDANSKIDALQEKVDKKNNELQ